MIVRSIIKSHDISEEQWKFNLWAVAQSAVSLAVSEFFNGSSTNAKDASENFFNDRSDVPDSICITIKHRKLKSTVYLENNEEHEILAWAVESHLPKRNPLG